MKSRSKNTTHRTIGQMILMDHILDGDNKRRLRTAPRYSRRPVVITRRRRPKTTNSTPEVKVDEEKQEQFFPSWLQKSKSFCTIINENVESMIGNNKALTSFFHQEKRRPALSTSFKVKQYASINDLERRLLNSRKREIERTEQDSIQNRQKSDDFLTRKKILHDIVRGTRAEAELEENARLSNNIWSSSSSNNHHKTAQSRNSSLHRSVRRLSNMSLVSNVVHSNNKHKFGWKRRWTEQMMARHLSLRDLRMLKVLRDATEKEQMTKRLEGLHLNHSVSVENQVPSLSMKECQKHSNQRNEKERKEQKNHGDIEKRSEVVHRKKTKAIETPRSRYLRQCSESAVLTGAQMFGIAVLKRED